MEKAAGNQELGGFAFLGCPEDITPRFQMKFVPFNVCR